MKGWRRSKEEAFRRQLRDEGIFETVDGYFQAKTKEDDGIELVPLNARAYIGLVIGQMTTKSLQVQMDTLVKKVASVGQTPNI